MHRSFIAYTRVSTTRQGTEGVSLREQRRAIKAYATKHNLTITCWYEEQQTAAKHARPIFKKVLRALRSGTCSDLVLDDLDRGARNLRVWAAIGEAIDSCADFRFANDDCDMITQSVPLSRKYPSHRMISLRHLN